MRPPPDVAVITLLPVQRSELSLVELYRLAGQLHEVVKWIDSFYKRRRKKKFDSGMLKRSSLLQVCWLPYL